jgi:tetratricopeptide (TPR) repeat protein
MLLKARTLKHIGQPRRAEICLRRVLLMKPSTRVEVKACLELAEYYHEQGRLRDSEKLLKKIISEAPRSHEAVAANRLLSQINNRSVGK